MSIHENDWQNQTIRGKAAESKLSVSLIPVDESKREGKNLVLSSALSKLLVDSKENNHISGDGVGIEFDELKEKDVTEGMILVVDTNKETTVDKGEVMKISCNADNVESKEVTEEKDGLVHDA